MTEKWLQEFHHHLSVGNRTDQTAEQMAELIHHALLVAEAQKYATEKSCFAFTVSGATVDDIAEIRRHLTAFENSIVELRRV